MADSYSNFGAEYGTDDPRLGALIKPLSWPLQPSSSSSSPPSGKHRVALLGFPHDEGVRRNGGRVGAREGPRVAREYIHKVGAIVNLELGCDLRQIEIYDASDVDAGVSLEDAHKQLTDRVAQLVSAGFIPFVVGGGNDESYPNVSGLLAARSKQMRKGLAVINIDAHLDVRPLKDGRVHSGTPFMQMLQDERFAQVNGKFVEFAAQGSQCSAQHVRALESHGGRVMWLKDVTGKHDTGDVFGKLLTDLPSDSAFMSFDLDAGVSCASPAGLSAQNAFDICFESGKSPKVVLCDLSEFNPTIESYRTGRLVAMMFYYFCCGLTLRQQQQ
ncbi:hypothetical protein RI367_008440 [Sorochytrium milnesiophthora]